MPSRVVARAAALACVLPVARQTRVRFGVGAQLGACPATPAATGPTYSCVRNLELAELLPDAPLGTGGGYAIVRNSWGPCVADSGSIDVPHDVMRTYAYSMVGCTKNFVSWVP